MAERVLIVGGGYVGSALGVRLAGEGHLVWALRRRVGELPRSVTGVEADLRVPNTLRHLPDVDWVFYLARADGDRDEDLRAAHVEGFGYLVAALSAGRIRARRLFYGSCVEVYGGDGGRWVDEDSAAEPQGPRAVSLREGERLAAEAPFPATVVRLGRLYGPGRLGLLDPVLRAEPLSPARALVHLNLLHRDDAVGVLRHLWSLKRPEPLYVATDREPVRGAELAAWLARRLDRPAPAVDGAEEGAGAAPVDVRCMSERVVEAGYRFAYPSYREGYRTLLSRLR